jgi:hypothetical protein
VKGQNSLINAKLIYIIAQQCKHVKKVFIDTHGFFCFRGSSEEKEFLDYELILPKF